METKKEKITILVCAHKPDEHIRNYPPYKAIQVGAALHPEMDLGFLKDNVGDNISEKNPKYCELSAIYWGWKNLKNVEYAGLAHYRRYFDIDINDDNVDELMKGYDMMVVKRMKTFYFAFNKGGLTYATSQDDFWLCLDTLLYMRPEYKSEIIDYLSQYKDYILEERWPSYEDNEFMLVINRPETSDEIVRRLCLIVESRCDDLLRKEEEIASIDKEILKLKNRKRDILTITNCEE